FIIFFVQGEDGIRDPLVTGVQTCALPISPFEPHVGDSPLDLAESLEGRAHAEGGLAEFAAAAELYGRVLTLRRRALPEEHPEIAGSVVHLAAALGDAGQVVAADSLFRYGIAAARGSLGDDHPDV